jgi:hypothetical protein
VCPIKRNIFIILFISFCIAAANADNEIWRPVESANDLIGKWKGNTIYEIQENLDEMMPKSSLNIGTIFEYSKNTKTEDSDCKFSMSIDFDKFLDDLLKLPGIKEYSISKENIWGMLELIFNSVDEISGYDVSVEKYCINFSFDGEIDAMFNNASLGQVLLNSDKNKMKFHINSEIPLSTGSNEFMELILHKVE